MSESSQSSVNSRVNIKYEVVTDGAVEKVSLPFVVGVMADLSGKPAEPLPSVHERNFLEFTHENFNDRLRAAKPRVAFTVPNTLGGGGNLKVDMTFESMDDFDPGRVAAKVAPLAKLLDVRQKLDNLLTYLDGDAKAEEALAELLRDPALRRAMMSARKEPAKLAATEETR